MVHVLANLIVTINLQYITLYIFNLHYIICQCFNKSREELLVGTSFGEVIGV